MNCEYVEATSCHAEFLSKHCGSFGKKIRKILSDKSMDFRFFVVFFWWFRSIFCWKIHPWKVLSWQLVGPRELGPGNPIGQSVGREWEGTGE